MSVAAVSLKTHAPVVTVHDDPGSMFAEHGIRQQMANPGAVPGVEQLTAFIAPAVEQAREQMSTQFESARAHAARQIELWSSRIDRWTHEADALIQVSSLKQRRVGVEEERRLAAEREPDRHLVRPLVVVVPPDHQPNRPTAPEV